MHSLSYSLLPPWLMEPVMQGNLPLLAALELWDLWLLTPPGQETEIPPHLFPAIEALWLLELPTRPVRTSSWVTSFCASKPSPAKKGASICAAKSGSGNAASGAALGIVSGR